MIQPQDDEILDKFKNVNQYTMLVSIVYVCIKCYKSAVWVMKEDVNQKWGGYGATSWEMKDFEKVVG